GNSAALTVFAGEGDWREAFRRGLPIPVFVIGVAAGTAVCGFAGRRGVRPLFAPGLGLETILLLAFPRMGTGRFPDGLVPVEPTARYYVTLALPILAMGLQNAALRRVGGVGIHTTFVTGMLTNFGEEAMLCLLPSTISTDPNAASKAPLPR